MSEKKFTHIWFEDGRKFVEFMYDGQSYHIDIDRYKAMEVAEKLYPRCGGFAGRIEEAIENGDAFLGMSFTPNPTVIIIPIKP